MRSFVSSLVAITLLAHSMVGCCRHAHHAQTCCDTAECCDSHASDCCHNEHATEGHHDTWPFEPCDCKIYCKAMCVSLPPEKAVVDLTPTARSIDVVAVLWTVPTMHASAADANRDAARASRLLGPPLRLHLLHQIILV
jgi:hypothetical protein